MAAKPHDMSVMLANRNTYLIRIPSYGTVVTSYGGAITSYSWAITSYSWGIMSYGRVITSYVGTTTVSAVESAPASALGQ